MSVPRPIRGSFGRYRPLRIETLEHRRLLSIVTPYPTVDDEEAVTVAPELAGVEMTAESTQIDTIVSLDEIDVATHTGEKPQSKVWSHDQTWWAVIPLDSGGTWIARLDGLAWTPVLQLASGSYKSDVTSTDDTAHILLEDKSSSRFASVEYVPGNPGTYRFSSSAPEPSSIALDGNTETATLVLTTIKNKRGVSPVR